MTAGFWTGRRVMVTGGSGFVGHNVVRLLNAQGAEVTVPRSSQHDLTQPGVAEQLMRNTRPQTVIHLAARVGGIGANMADPANLYLVNLLLGTYVLEAALATGVEKSVLVGTICSYPKFTPVPFKEDDLWNGYPEETNAPYGVAKKALLVHANANLDQYGQKFCFLMPTNLYGPGDKFHPSVSHVIPALIRKFVTAKEAGDPTVEVWGTGSASREFLYVDDAAHGVVLAAERYDSPEPANLGANEETSIRDLATTIATLVGYEGELVWDNSKPDGQPRRCVDPSRAEEGFGFKASMPLEEGLRRTIEWYKANREAAEASTW